MNPANAQNFPQVAVILLNWNGWVDTIECLNSLYLIDYPKYDVIVVDNGSEDESIERIRDYACSSKIVLSEIDSNDCSAPYTCVQPKDTSKACDEREKQEVLAMNRTLTLIRIRRNLGFAEGNNIGIRHVAATLNPDYFLLLNNDTVVDKKLVSELVKIGESTPKAGIVGPKIYHYNTQGRKDIIDFAGEDLVMWKVQGIRYGYGQADNGQYDNLREVNKIDGACMLIKKKVIETIGFLDADFFSYWEETDYCLRAKRRGYAAVYVPTAKIWHKIAVSTGGLHNPARIYYQSRNRLFFAAKNLNGFDKTKFLIYFLAYSLWLNIGTILRNRKTIRALPSFLKGTFDGLARLLKPNMPIALGYCPAVVLSDFKEIA